MTDDPVLITSGLSQSLDEDGYVFEINIFRLEEETGWTLEVIDRDNTSHVWDDPFSSDAAALSEAKTAIRAEGPLAFMAGGRSPTIH